MQCSGFDVLHRLIDNRYQYIDILILQMPDFVKFDLVSMIFFALLLHPVFLHVSLHNSTSSGTRCCSPATSLTEPCLQSF